MRGIWQDICFGVRALVRSPGFTLVAGGVLAVGIGASGVIFSLVDATLIRPLPFARPHELVMLWEHAPDYAHNRVSPLNYLDWSEQHHSFAALAAVSGGSRSLTGPGEGPERIQGQSVSVSFFALLGVNAIAGRTFVDGDAASGAAVVVLSERLWRRRFNADPSLVGRAIVLDDQPFTVVGIVPADFQILYSAEIWTPFVPKRSPEQRRMHYLQVLGRLKPGIDIEQARTDMAIVADRISAIAPATNKGWGVTIDPLHDALVQSDLRVTSLVLAGVVLFVVLMSCANIANLQLARGIERSRDLAVRAALGASTPRIIGFLLTESLLLASFGGVAGLAVAWAAVRAAPAIMPRGTLPESIVMAFDFRLTMFTAALTAATGVLIALVPAWHATWTPLAETFGSGGRTATRRRGALRTALAAGQVAVAVLLVSGAALLLRTLMSLNSVDPGYHAQNVLTMRVSLPLGRYPTAERQLAFYQAAEREIGLLPGVREVSAGGSLPEDGWDIGQGFEVVGAPHVDEGRHPSAHYQMVGARYFETLGIPLRHGRTFTTRDTASAAPVCIVNEELVRRYLSGREPLGVRLTVQAMDPGGPKPVVREIVGVIGQVKVEGPGENAVEIYVPIAQNTWTYASIAVQAVGSAPALVPAVKAAIARVDKDQPVTAVRTMDEIAADATSSPRFRAEFLGAFAALALVLAAVGVFGVLAFSVNQRLREFGIRLALGAKPAEVRRLVMMGGIRIVAAGTLSGLAAAALLTRTLESLLYGVRPLDLPTFIAAPAVLIVTALVACLLPALRAARVDPAAALRHE